MSLNGSYQSHHEPSAVFAFYGCCALMGLLSPFFRAQLLGTLHFQSGPGFYLETGLSIMVFSGAVLARPASPPQAELLQRSRAVRALSNLGWVLLLATCWVALTMATSSLLASAFLSMYLSSMLVQLGWWAWQMLSPTPPPLAQSPAVGDNPSLQGGLRAQVLPTSRERGVEALLRVVLPLLTLVVVVGLPLWQGAFRASMTGLAASALLSLPAYLWAGVWADHLCRRELELVADGRLLEYSRSGRRVRLLGAVEELKPEGADAYLFTIGGEPFALPKGELSTNLASTVGDLDG